MYDEKKLRRLEILRRYKQNERTTGIYKVDEGIYDVEICTINLKENCNQNAYIQFVCKNLSSNGPKKLYGIYYLTENTEEASITSLRCLLGDFGYDDITDEEVIDDFAIFERLQVLVGKNAKLVVEEQDGFLSSKVYKVIPNE